MIFDLREYVQISHHVWIVEQILMQLALHRANFIARVW